MSISIHNEQLLFAKPSYKIRTLSTRASDQPTLFRTKKLSSSHIRHSSNKCYTLSAIPQQDSFLYNSQKIRVLKKQLAQLNSRKFVLQNPQYPINLNQDISIWRNSIKVLQNQLQSLKNQRLTQRKTSFKQQMKFKQIRQQLQEYIKNNTFLNEEISNIQQQISLMNNKICEQNYKIEILQDKQVNSSYLKKLKYIDNIQQQINKNNKHLNNKYQSSKKTLNDLHESIFDYEFRTKKCDQSFIEQRKVLNKLLIQYYGEGFGNQNQDIN